MCVVPVFSSYSKYREIEVVTLRENILLETSILRQWAKHRVNATCVHKELAPHELSSFAFCGLSFMASLQNCISFAFASVCVLQSKPVILCFKSFVPWRLSFLFANR